MANIDQEDKNSSLLLGLLFGLISGTVITLLSTPKTGEQIRDEITQRKQELEKGIKKKQESLPQEVNSLFQEIKNFYRETSELASSKVKTEIDKAREEITQQTRQLKETLSNQVSIIKEAYKQAKESKEANNQEDLENQ